MCKHMEIRTVTVGEGSGFCFGVRRAAESLEAKLAEKKRLRAEERARRAEERRRAKEEAMGQTLIEADIIPEDDSDLDAEAKIAEMLDNQLSDDDEDLLDDIGLDMNDIIKSMAEQAKNLPDDNQ